MSTWTNALLNFLFENYEPHKYIPIKTFLINNLKVDENEGNEVGQIKDFLHSLVKEHYIIWESNKGEKTYEKAFEEPEKKIIISDNIQARLTTEGYFKMVDRKRADEQHFSIITTNLVQRRTNRSTVRLTKYTIGVAFLSVIVSLISLFKECSEKPESDRELKQSIKHQARMMDSLSHGLKKIDSTSKRFIEDSSKKLN